jgi:hypothetical protein
MRTLLLAIAVLASAAAAEPGGGIGRGAFRDGPTLRLDGGGDETLLEKLRRLDLENAASRDALAKRDQAIADLERENALLRERGKDLSGRLELLEHARISLEQARQEVADRGRRLDLLAAQVTAAERARLLAERYTFDLSAEILAMQPADAQKLLDLQSRLRAMVEHQQPTVVEPK